MKADVDAFLLEGRMETVRRYLQQGRRFEGLSGADLSSNWINAFKMRSASPMDPTYRKLVDDLQAEMEVRKIEPPFDEVKAEFDAFLAFTEQSIGRLKADPDRWAEANEELQADIDVMKAKRDTTAKN